MPTYHSFEELDCYQKCRAVRIWINELIKNQTIKDRDLIQNIRRAGRSATRNIAEGFGRHHPKENIQFCRIAIGSLHETLEDLNIVRDEITCKSSEIEEGRILIYKALKSLRGYVQYLRSRA